MELPEQVACAIDRLERAGYQVVTVGGCVRDHLMGRVPVDYDLSTSAAPAEVMRVFSDECVAPTGLKHGTVTLVLSGMAMEITTFRVDGEYLDHRRPEVVRFTGSLEEDLARRDFTINAMAWSPSRGLIDPMGGRGDLALERIRAVGMPRARFMEDALRILRALRFASKLGFSIEPQTAHALTELREKLGFIARERIGVELTGIFGEPGCHGSGARVPACFGGGAFRAFQGFRRRVCARVGCALSCAA